MTSDSDEDPNGVAHARPVQLELALPRHEQSEINELLKAFDKGELNPDQVVSKLMVLYQTGVGGAARALAELDKAAAQKLGERLRQRIESLLSELHSVGSAPKASSRKAPAIERLKSKGSAILQRDRVLFAALARTDQDIPSPKLVALVRSLEPDIAEPTVTAHLDRLTKEGLIARERKGHYRRTPRSKEYLAAVEAEIEARGVPPRP